MFKYKSQRRTKEQRHEICPCSTRQPRCAGLYCSAGRSATAQRLAPAAGPRAVRKRTPAGSSRRNEIVDGGPYPAKFSGLGEDLQEQGNRRRILELRPWPGSADRRGRKPSDAATTAQFRRESVDEGVR